MPTDAEVAWFAGVFEGEGYFATTKRSTVRMGISMCGLDIIERVNSLFPCSGQVLRKERRHEGHKDIYVWRIGQQEQVAEVIGLILPWLGQRRRERALELLEHIKNRPALGEPNRTHCKQGHALTADNLVKRGGMSPYWRCKTCAAHQQAVYIARRRSERKAGQVISA